MCKIDPCVLDMLVGVPSGVDDRGDLLIANIGAGGVASASVVLTVEGLHPLLVALIEVYFRADSGSVPSNAACAWTLETGRRDSRGRFVADDEDVVTSAQVPAAWELRTFSDVLRVTVALDQIASETGQWVFRCRLAPAPGAPLDPDLLRALYARVKVQGPPTVVTVT